jgi:hypothetical protein
MLSMMPSGGSCCVCGARDARALVDVLLPGGARATLCGSHALIHRRTRLQPRSESELRALLSDRRTRGDRREVGDELGAALASAFSDERREQSRRRA